MAGKTGFGSKVLEAIQDIVGRGGGSDNVFGIYLTEAGLGMLFQLPAGEIIEDFLPPFAPDIYAGVIKLKCHVDITGADTGFHCGVEYGAPRWLAAVWKDIDGVAKKVFGAVKETSEEAVASAKEAADKVGRTITHAAGAVATWTKKTARKTGDVIKHVFAGEPRRRRFILRRRRRFLHRRRRRWRL